MTTEASAPEKYAIRKLLRLPNGTVGVFYVDAMTGAILDNLSGYALVTAGNLEGPSEDNGTGTNTPAEEDTGDKRDNPGGGGGGSGYTPLNAYPNTQNYKGINSKGQFPPAPKPQNVPSLQEYANVNNIPLDKIPVPQPYDLNSYETGYKQEYSNPGRSLTDAERVSQAAPTSPGVTGKSSGKSFVPMAGDIEDTTRPTPTMSETGAASQEKYYGGVDPYQSLTDKTSSLMESVARTAAEQGTTATINSGYRDPEHNVEVGGTAGSLHQQGKSFDLDLTGMTDAQKQAILTDIAFQTMGTGSVGFYPGSNVIHVDAQRQFNPNPTMNPGVQNAGGMNVMYDRTQKNAYQNIPDWAKGALTREAIGALAPIPQERPAQGSTPSSLLGNTKGQAQGTPYDIKDQGLGGTGAVPARDVYASKDAGLGGSPTVLPSGASGSTDWGTSANSKASGNEKTTAQKINEGVTSSLYNIPDDVNLNDMTPAQAASYGATGTRSPEQIAGMAKVIAGEVMPQTITAAVKGDPVAMAELNSVIASMENRDYSDPSKGYSSTQYDANKTGNSMTTAQNYGIYGPTIENYLSDFYSGKLSGVGNMAATSYYSPGGLKNLGLSTPKWGPLMADVTPYGYQVFGSLPEYSSTYQPSPSFVDQVATDRINRSAASSDMSYPDMASNPITSSAPNFMDSGDSYSSPYDSKDSGLGGSSATRGSGSDSYESPYDSKDSGLGGTSATTSGGSTYDNSKDSGLGGSSATSSSSSKSSGTGSLYDSTSVANGGGNDYSSLGSWF